MALKTRTYRTSNMVDTRSNAGTPAPKSSKATYQVVRGSFRKVTGLNSSAPSVEGEAIELGGQNGYFAQHKVTGWRVFVVCTGVHAGVWSQVDSTGWPMVNDMRTILGARY